jgi:Tol biopolymer transport system component
MAAARRSVLFVLVLVAGGCTGTTTPPAPSSTATPQPPSFGPPAEPLIAFHSDPGGRDDTYVMAPDGRKPIAVTDGMETIAQPFWSPDGKRMVVECCASAPGRLYLLDGPGAEPVELASGIGEVTAPAWSPDGETIAFESTDDGSVSVIDVGGGEPGAPVELFPGAGPSWSPDGSRIAYFAEVDGNLDIYSAASDGTDVTRLTDDPAADYSPVWSPAGGRIAFVSERDGDQDVFVMATDGSDQTDVSSNGVVDDFPAWSPDGRSIAFVSYLHGADPFTIGEGDAEIFVVRVSGGDAVAVSRNRAWDGDPAWSPDGRWIVFTRRTDHAEIYVMRPDGSDQRHLRGLGGIANDCCPAWRPSRRS